MKIVHTSVYSTVKYEGAEYIRFNKYRWLKRMPERVGMYKEVPSARAAELEKLLVISNSGKTYELIVPDEGPDNPVLM